MNKLKLFFLTVLLSYVCNGQLNFTVSSSTGNFSLTCKNSVITISATSNFSNPVSYSWTSPQQNPTIISNSLNIIFPGIYTVTATSGTITTTQALVIGSNTIIPSLSLTATSSSITCLNKSVTLTAVANPTNVQYSWVDPGFGFPCTTYTCVEYVSGNYWVNIVDPINGCSNSATISIHDGRLYPFLVTNSLFTIACPNGTVDLLPTINSSTSGLIFQWNVPPNAATSATNNLVLNTNAPGTYSFLATNTLSGCSSRAEINVFACVGMAEENQLSTIIFPNPFENILNIKNISVASKDFRIRLLNIAGEIVFETVDNSPSLYFDLSDKPTGVYFLEISQGNSHSVIRLLKQ